MKLKMRDIFNYKRPAFWIIAASVVSFLVVTVCVLKLLIGGSKGARQDALNAKEEHSYTSEIIEAATCTSAGTVKFTCEKCGDSYTESMEPTSHSYISTATSEGNCSVRSTETYTCSVCGDTYMEEGELNPAIHSALTTETSAAPTCTKEGVKTTFCSGCGYTATESMSAFGHSFASATRTAPETCTRCGLSQGKRLGHAVHGGNCYACGKYIPAKNVVEITGIDQRIYLNKNDPEFKNSYIVIKDCTVDYSDPKGAIINFVVDATNAPLPDNINRYPYEVHIMNDMTGEVVYGQYLFIYNLDDPITTDSLQVYMTVYGEVLPNGDYTVSFGAYDQAY